MIIQFQELHWEAGPLLNGSRLYYGDYVLTRSNAVVTVDLQDGMKLSIVPGTSIRISRTELLQKKKTVVEKWITLFNGKVRAMVEQKRKDAEYTKFRTQSLAMGVRGTDFVIEGAGSQSKVLTIEGEVAVRPVSAEENNAFEVINSAVNELSDDAAVSRATEVLTKAAELPPQAVVSKGMKVEAVVPTATGAADVATKLVATQIDKQEVLGLKEMSSTLGAMAGEAETRNLTNLEAEVTAKEKLEETAKNDAKPIPTKPNYKHHAWVHAAALVYDLGLPDDNSVIFRSTGIVLDYRYSPWKFVDIGGLVAYVPSFSTEYTGYDSAISGMEVVGGLGLAAARVAGKVSLGAFTGGLSFSVLASTGIEIAYIDGDQQILSSYDIEHQPMLSMFFSFRFKDRFQAGIELGGTDVYFQRDSSSGREVVSLMPDEQGVAFLRVGAGWGF